MKRHRTIRDWQHFLSRVELEPGEWYCAIFSPSLLRLVPFYMLGDRHLHSLAQHFFRILMNRELSGANIDFLAFRERMLEFEALSGRVKIRLAFGMFRLLLARRYPRARKILRVQLGQIYPNLQLNSLPTHV